MVLKKVTGKDVELDMVKNKILCEKKQMKKADEMYLTAEQVFKKYIK